MKYLLYIAVFLAGYILASFVCSNFNINPFGGVHGEGSSDTVYSPKVITVESPSVTAPILHGKPLNETQKISLHTSRIKYVRVNDIDTVRYDSTKSYNEPSLIDSICPPFAIDTSLKWKLTHRLVLWDTAYTSLDSGFYKVYGIVDPATGRIIDFSVSSTPLHPVIIEKQITNTVTVKNNLWLVGYGEYDFLNKSYAVGIRARVRLGGILPYASAGFNGNLITGVGTEAIIFEK